MPGRLTAEDVVTIQVLSKKGVASRAVARQLGVTEGAVRYRLRRQASGATDGRGPKVFAAASLTEVVDAFCAATSDGERPPNVKALYEHLVAEHGYAASYKSVVRYVRSRFGRPPLRTYRRVETPPGAQAQTDWGHFTALDIGDGPQLLYVFVMVLSHCRKPALVWSERADQVSWIACHNRAFERFGGIPAVNRIDNVKTAISRGAGAWGTRHPTYAAYARTMGFHIDACAPREPQQKGKTEAKVKLSRRLIDPKRDRFQSLAELQEVTDERVERFCERTLCPATGLSIAETFAVERAALRPLPRVLPEPFDVAVLREVALDCMVAFEGRRYAVPFAFAGRTVEVRGCAGRVQILGDAGVLREYPRHSAERLLLDPSCYEGKATAEARPPPPLGRMGRRLQEICAMPVAKRPLDLYAALAEASR
jgi:transposase